MKRLRPAQLKALSDFASKVAAAWFSAGVISPFFAKRRSLGEVLVFPLVGLMMSGVTLIWSLFLVKAIKL